MSNPLNYTELTDDQRLALRRVYRHTVSFASKTGYRASNVATANALVKLGWLEREKVRGDKVLYEWAYRFTPKGLAAYEAAQS